MQYNPNNILIEDDSNFRDEFVRYASFWPYLLLLIITLSIFSFLYLRYATYIYESTAVIEILDEAQDSEMALPTELTVFNRSMINLENEINRLNSFSIHSQVASKLKSNIIFYDVGNIKKSKMHRQNWYDNYAIDFKNDTDLVDSTSTYSIKVEENKLFINSFDNSNDILSQYSFNSLTTTGNTHNLPFELTIYSDSKISNERQLKIIPLSTIVAQIKDNLIISPLGKDSDQLSIQLLNENKIIGEEYLNELMLAFDLDGIKDRQLEYQRTIEFVDDREIILKNELELVEFRKQKFKQENNLSDLTLDAGNNIDQKYSYDGEIFNSESQKTIASYLLESISENNYDYLPINIGLNDFDLNNIISEYNLIVTQRNKYLSEAGPNNILVKSLQSQLDNLIVNISVSINNYLESIDIKIKNLVSKELEYDNLYNRVPQNEKTLRSIERELSVKEALYLLLLQKREEASINLAVVKPTIKIIDYPISNNLAKYPKPALIYLSGIVSAFLIYFSFLFIWFSLDNKIHNKEQLMKKINKNIPIISEIPFIRDIKSSNAKSGSPSSDNRSILSESIRMLISNLKFTNLDFDSKRCKSIVFTSSIKGEGKTLVSVNTALSLANDLSDDKKVILLGADLRNPQVHKNFGVEKHQKGISEIIYRNDHKNYINYIKRFDNLDVLFSGSIPPNPTALLSSKAFKDLYLILQKNYDYIIIDSAPCLLVSDTFQYIELADTVVYLFRTNYTQEKITDFINEIYESKRLKNINVVLNAVGNSSIYGYKYGYQYGYKYGYKYGYNYGYGYGYSSSDN